MCGYAAAVREQQQQSCNRGTISALQAAFPAHLDATVPTGPVAHNWRQQWSLPCRCRTNYWPLMRPLPRLLILLLPLVLLSGLVQDGAGRTGGRVTSEVAMLQCACRSLLNNFQE